MCLDILLIKGAPHAMDVFFPVWGICLTPDFMRPRGGARRPRRVTAPPPKRRVSSMLGPAQPVLEREITDAAVAAPGKERDPKPSCLDLPTYKLGVERGEIRPETVPSTPRLLHMTCLSTRGLPPRTSVKATSGQGHVRGQPKLGRLGLNPCLRGTCRALVAGPTRVMLSKDLCVETHTSRSMLSVLKVLKDDNQIPFHPPLRVHLYPLHMLRIWNSRGFTFSFLWCGFPHTRYREFSGLVDS